MHYFLSYLLAVVLTSLSYFLGSLFMQHSIGVWPALLIGISVVSLGAVTEALRSPVWLVIFIPFPVGMVLLYLFLKEPLHFWLITYLIILLLYTMIHVFMSYFFHFHSLIPAWKLS